MIICSVKNSNKKVFVVPNIFSIILLISLYMIIIFDNADDRKEASYKIEKRDDQSFPIVFLCT